MQSERREKTKRSCVIENRPQQLNGLNDSIKNRHFMSDADGIFTVNKIMLVVLAWADFVILRLKRVKPLYAPQYGNYSFFFFRQVTCSVGRFHCDAVCTIKMTVPNFIIGSYLNNRVEMIFAKLKNNRRQLKSIMKMVKNRPLSLPTKDWNKDNI